MKILNRPELKENRKNLRKKSTFAEVYLWKHLKNKQVKGLRFRRQYSVENYIIDFYCTEIKLGIELDGEGHVYNEKYDNIRDIEIGKLGIVIKRFENCIALEFPDNIISEIEEFYENWKNVNNL